MINVIFKGSEDFLYYYIHSSRLYKPPYINVRSMLYTLMVLN